MDPFLEQKLRDEVLYLHSLFHQSPLSKPLPNSSNFYLQPSISTKFKKPKKKKKPTSKPKKVANFSGTEWPVKPLPDNPPVTQSGWPELKLKPNTQTTRLLTPQELEKRNWNLLQQKKLKLAKEFYSENVQESDEDENDNDDDFDDMDGDCDDVENKVYEFLLNLFDGDEELKGYYVKHCGGGGEFSCFVCGGRNEKLLKKYKDCIALVQHSSSIAKTKRIRSHRAYGKVICKVLGWDIDRLPSSIVSDHKSSELQGNVADKIVDNGESNGKSHHVLKTVDGESMVCEESCVEANVEEENDGNQVLNEAGGNTTGAVNTLCRNLSSTMVLEAAPQNDTQMS